MGEAMTDQERTARYAKEMGYEEWIRPEWMGSLGLPAGKYLKHEDGRVFISPSAEDFIEYDPRTSVADAVELAEKMDIEFRRTFVCSYHQPYAARNHSVDNWRFADNLCEAICKAADAYLDGVEKNEFPKQVTEEG